VGVAKKHDFHEITLALEETFRGEQRQAAEEAVGATVERRTVRLAGGGRGAEEIQGGALWSLLDAKGDLARSKDAAHRFLVAAGGSPLTVCALVDLDDEKLQVWQQDLTPLRKAADVLQAVRATIRREPDARATETFRLAVPYQGKYGSYFGFAGHTHVVVPANEALQKRALAYIRADNRWQRAEGARALRLFKSDDHVARLKALLNDPTTIVINHAEDNLGIEVRHYPVRAAALETLKSWGVQVAAPTLSEESAKLELVRRLELSENVTVQKLKELDRFPNLEFIRFSVADVSPEVLRELPRFKNLRGLELGAAARLTDDKIAHLAALANLQHLEIADARISDRGLSALVKLQKLTDLNLDGTSITDAGLQHLARLQSLEWLSLRKTRVTGDGLKELNGLKKLKALCLHKTQITDVTLRRLREMNLLHALIEASARRPADLPHYASSPRPTLAAEVFALDLADTSVSDIGLKELVDLTNLAELNVSNTKVTAAGVAQLRKAVPNCKVTR